MKTLPLTALAITLLLAILPVVSSAQPFTLSADGNEVTDQGTGLIWRRCSEGLSGSNCQSGTGSLYTHEAALQRASNESTRTQLAWRLPNVKELYSIVDLTSLNPAINANYFPATLAGVFWSSSPYVGDAANAWYVNFYDGSVGGTLSSVRFYVRLVRAGQ